MDAPLTLSVFTPSTSTDTTSAQKPHEMQHEPPRVPTSIGNRGEDTLVTITFDAVGDKTKMTFLQTGFSSEQDRNGHRGGWNSTFDRLEEYLASVRASAAK